MDKHLSYSCSKIKQSAFRNLLWITVFVVGMFADYATFLLMPQVNKLAGDFH